MRYLPFMFACAALSALSLTANAQNLTYTLSGVGDFSITPVGGGIGQSFVGSTFSFIEVSNPALVTNSGGVLFTPLTIINLNLGGSAGQTTAQFRLQNSGGSSSIVGVTNTGQTGGLTGQTTTAGPLTLTAPQSLTALAFFQGNGALVTTLGTVAFSNTTSLTFTSTGAVPEPGSVALLIGGGISCAGFLRRRKACKTA